MANPTEPTHRRTPDREIKRLLAVRADLAAEVYEQLSHGQDGVWDLVDELLHLERQLEVLAPEQYRRRAPGWARAEARQLHTPGAPHAKAFCARCNAAPRASDAA